MEEDEPNTEDSPQLKDSIAAGISTSDDADGKEYVLIQRLEKCPHRHQRMLKLK